MNATAPNPVPVRIRAPQRRAADHLLGSPATPCCATPPAADPTGGRAATGDPWVEAELLGQDAFLSGLPAQNPFPEGPDDIALSLHQRWAAGWNAAENEFWRAWRCRVPGLNGFDAWAKKHYPKVGERLQRERKAAAVKTRCAKVRVERPAGRKTSQKPAAGVTLAG